MRLTAPGMAPLLLLSRAPPLPRIAPPLLLASDELKLAGDVERSIDVPFQPDGRGLADFLGSAESDRVLIGADDAHPAGDGSWVCSMPAIDFLQISLKSNIRNT